MDGIKKEQRSERSPASTLKEKDPAIYIQVISHANLPIDLPIAVLQSTKVSRNHYHHACHELNGNLHHKDRCFEREC